MQCLSIQILQLQNLITLWIIMMLWISFLSSCSFLSPDKGFFIYFLMLTVQPSGVQLAKVKTDAVFTAPCKPLILYPAAGGNMHCFTAKTSCAVLDVLGPPYNDSEGRHCTYYHDYPYASFSGLFSKMAWYFVFPWPMSKPFPPLFSSVQVGLTVGAMFWGKMLRMEHYLYIYTQIIWHQLDY